MGTTSQKLEYLSGTKNSLKSAINNLGGAIDSNTTFRAYASELDTIYDNLPKVSNTGTNVSLNPTLKGRLGIVPKGNTLQDGEPTPETPVETQSATGTQKVVVSGKNLFSGGSSISFTKSTTIHLDKPLPAGTYTCGAIITSNDTDDTRNLIQFRSDASGTQNKSISLGRTTRDNATTTTTFETNYITIYASTSNARSDGDTATITDMQIEQGSIATPYQPYQEPQEVDIELSSRNIYDGVESHHGTNASGDITTYNTYLGVEDWIKVKPNTTYTITFEHNDSDASLVVSSKDKNNVFISRDFYQKARTFTTGPTTYYVFPYMYKSTDFVTIGGYIQLEEGSTATDYTPYYNYSLNKIGDYEDYIGGTPDNWVLYKNIGKVVLDGSESWGRDYGNNLFNLYGFLNDKPYIVGYGISNYYKYNPVQSGIDANTVNGEFALQLSSNTYNIFIKNTNFNNASDFKTWLSTHNTEIIYPLANIEQTPITDTNLIIQLNELYYLQSYNDTTNIDVTGNLPMRITASAIKGA